MEKLTRTSWVTPIEDEANVDARRREVGLLSLANDMCLARAIYGTRASQ